MSAEPETQTSWSPLRDWFAAHRALIGKFVFEIVIVFVGVTAAFAMEGVRQTAEEAAYRRGMISALAPTLDDLLRHNAEFHSEVTAKLAAFDAARARGEQPAIPVFRERNSERPPVRAWDGVVATGAARSLEPKLFFDLALFYTRQESFGERYVRYNDFTEQRVFAAGVDPAVFYDASGGLKPEFAAHIDRLRDLLAVNDALSADARRLKAQLLAQR